MAKIRVGINGFGRIGRNFFRAHLERGGDFEIVAANDLGDAKTMAHLLQYDSVLGPLGEEVAVGDGTIRAGDFEIKMLAERDPAALPWGDLGVDVVLESTGLLHRRATARRSTSTPARRRSIISAPATEPDVTLVLGVNDDDVRPGGAPRDLERVLHDELPRAAGEGPARRLRDRAGLHDDDPRVHERPERLQDMPHKDLRRARAAAINLIPTSTGAAKAIGLVLPELQGQARRHRRPRARPDRLGHRPRRPALAGGDARRGDRRLPRGRRRAARDVPAVHRGPARLDRHRPLAVLVHLRQRADDGERPDGEGLRLVRQRVGLQLPARRPDRDGRGDAAGRSRRTA